MTGPDPARAGRKAWIGLAVLVLPCLLISMDLSVLFFALPFISHDLSPSGSQQLWIMDIYGFVLAGMLITMGALGDRIGRRRLLMIGALAFGVASVTTAYSTSAEMLIAARALLGVGGATLMPSTLALIRNMFHDAQQRRTAIAAWTGGISGGAFLGPIVGGLMLNHFWWGSAFMINVPVMVALLILAPVLVPEYRNPEPGRFDLLSATLSLSAVLPVIYGIKRMATQGLGPAAVVTMVAGVILGVVFIRRQQTLADPLIDVKLFRYRAFSGSVMVNVVGAFGMIGFSLFSTQYLQLVLGYSPLAAALWSLAASPAIFGAVAVAATLAKRVRPAFIIGIGLLISAFGFVVMTQVQVHSNLAVVLIGAAALAAGMLMATTLTGDLVLTTAPPERAGAAAAVSETGSELGGALGIAILGSIGAAVYRHHVADAIPAGLPPEAGHAMHETLGGATASARQLPEQAGAALLDTAREAFTQGMHTTAVTGAVVMTVSAVLVVILLRHVQVGAGTRPAAPEDTTHSKAAAVTP